MMSKQPLFRFMLSLALLTSAGSVAAQNQFEWVEPNPFPLEQLVVRVKQHLQSEIDHLRVNDDARYAISVHAPDPRLRLAQCDQDLDLKTTSGKIGRVAVKVSCASGTPWTIYMNAQIQAYRHVLVAAAPIPRNTLITMRDIALVEQDLSTSTRAYYTDPADVVGLLAKRSIRANQILAPSVLRLPKLVKRGDPVRMIAERGSVRIQVEGIAMSDGALGDTIRVRNPRSGRVVQAEVQSAGTVEVAI